MSAREAAAGASAPSAQVALIEQVWGALAQGDSDPLERALAPHARWISAENDEWACEGRGEIMQRIVRNLPLGGGARIEQMIERGERVLVAFRPARPPDGRPLEGGLAWVVVSIHDAGIVELKGCADKARALAYADAGDARPQGRGAP